jgi:LmbE family N-acetylglucosaminyl deacetylase
MRYLLLFAHPDDESFGCAGTIKKLIDQGDEVIIVSATDGAAGEVHETAQQKLEELGSVGELRRAELSQVSQFLNVTKLHILHFQDGEITNAQVWGKLRETFIDLIDQYKPDAVVTFDHSGWYFHLDHVGVSIAATLAFQQSTHRPEVLLFSYFRVSALKWKYIFAEKLPITHVVNIADLKEFKMNVLDLHASQDTTMYREKMLHDAKHQELYSVAMATEKGKKILEESKIFERVKN